jgi:hypothetical protein
MLFAVWLGWPRIVGVPAWLNEIGLLNWLKGVAPLDQWLIAFGTVSAVAYAIFSETFLSWWRRPKLRILFDATEPYVIQIPVLRPATTEANPSFQVRMLVKNEGMSRAEAVSVYARRLFRRSGGDLKLLAWFIPMDLKWAEDEKALTAISPGVERTCNVVGIEKPGTAARPSLSVPQAPAGFDYATNCFAHVQTVSDPTSFCNCAFPASYRLELVVSAANAKSQLLAFDFWLDGRWFDNRQDMIPGAASFSVRRLSADTVS